MFDEMPERDGGGGFDPHYESFYIGLQTAVLAAAASMEKDEVCTNCFLRGTTLGFALFILKVISKDGDVDLFTENLNEAIKSHWNNFEVIKGEGE